MSGRVRMSNLFGAAHTYLKRCCDDPSRPLSRSVRESPPPRRSRQGSGSLEEADPDGRGIPSLRRTAGSDALGFFRLEPRRVFALALALEAPQIRVSLESAIIV